MTVTFGFQTEFYGLTDMPEGFENKLQFKRLKEYIVFSRRHFNSW